MLESYNNSFLARTGGMSAAECKQDEEVWRPDSLSGNDAVVDILKKMSSNRTESCDEEVPTGRSTNLQSINQRPSALKTVEDDGSKQIELFLCQELEDKKTMPDILGCSGTGGRDAAVLRKVSTWANRAESGTSCSGGNDAVVDILEKPPSMVNRVESCSDEVPIAKRANLGCINQRRSAEQTVEDDGSKQVESFSEQTMDGSCLFPGSTRFIPGNARFQFKGYNKFNGKKTGLDNEYSPGTSCEKKPVASHCTCLHKKHEVGSSYSSGIVHHMSPIPEGFTTKQGKAGRVETWAIIYFSNIGAKQSVIFSNEVRDACVEIQMDIKQMPLETMFLDCALPDGIEDSLRDEYKFINTGVPRGKQLGLLIIVLPEVRDFDEKVEAVCEDLGVVYHCCFPQDVMNLNNQYLENMAYEINAKVLKRNSCCDYCKNIGLDGSSIEFFALDEELEDYDYSSDEGMSLDSYSDEVYDSKNVILMEGDDGSEESDKLGEIDTCFKEPRDLVEVERGIIIHWACISYSIKDYRQLFRFFSKLHAVCMANGMHFKSMPIKTELVDSAITAENLSKTWLDLCNSASKLFNRNGIKGAQIEFLLVILPECRDFDEEIEKFFNNLGVVYQLCLPITVRIRSNRHLKKFGQQIKFKVSKHGMMIPFVSEAPTILFGASISHCAPEEGSRSVSSVVASLDWPKVGQYGALVASQPHHEVIIRDLFNEYGGMVSNLILSFIRRTEELPQRMIFFRHGIIEGQLSHICQQEIHAIRQDCALLKYVPTLTYVFVTQRLNMEFQGSSNMTKKRFRVQQDTSRPTKFEVLCDHDPFEGTKMAVHYCVVHDENNLTAQELESIIIRLSLARDYEVYPEISMIPPAHFARLATHYYRRQPWVCDSRKWEWSDIALPSLGGLVIKPYGDRQYWSCLAGLLFSAAEATQHCLT